MPYPNREIGASAYLDENQGLAYVHQQVRAEETSREILTERSDLRSEKNIPLGFKYPAGVGRAGVYRLYFIWVLRAGRPTGPGGCPRVSKAVVKGEQALGDATPFTSRDLVSVILLRATPWRFGSSGANVRTGGGLVCGHCFWAGLVIGCVGYETY